MAQRLAAEVHEAWLERNSAWASEEEKQPYETLSEALQEKDAEQVRRGMVLLNKKLAAANA
jgi:hypothetical protein